MANKQIETAKLRIREIDIQIEGLKSERLRQLRVIKMQQDVCRHYRLTGTGTCIHCGKGD